MAINDDLYAALSAYPQTTLPERLFAYLVTQGYTGAMGDMLGRNFGMMPTNKEVVSGVQVDLSPIRVDGHSLLIEE